MFHRHIPTLKHAAPHNLDAAQHNNDAALNNHPSLPAGNPTVRSPAASLSLRAARRAIALSEFGTVLGAGLLTKLVYLDLILKHDPGWLPYLITSLVLGLTLYITYKQMGLYEVERLLGPDLNFGKLFGGLIISFLIVLGGLYAIKQAEDFSRGWVLIWLGLTALLIIPIRASIAGHIQRGVATGRIRRRIAVVGTAEYTVSLATRIKECENTSDLIELYSIEDRGHDTQFVGGISDLEGAMLSRPYDRVIVAIPARDTKNIRAVVRSLGSYTTELLLCSDLASPPITTAGVCQIGGIRADIVHLLPGSESLWLVKRAIDLTFASTMLLLLSPLLLAVALAIKIDSRGPVLFRQRRLGQNNAVFTIFKFRSMAVEEDGPVVIQAKRHDPRVTRIGRLIRAASVDELPQLLNVLLGHMSLVGPRPHAIVHDQLFEQQFDLFSRRRRVKPGITGWAQVNGFRGETKTPEDIRRRMEYDLYYIDHWSIWLDIEIIARTVLILPKGAY
jgi:putative colanic acid biosynthesis UDP-glucose lipid carrier transferase